mmetsp:Transcript_44098/g.81952  ORF Transcript_44098/g.81952 Transcript_44098/m.81952 type:complete len:311 (-) Transcript_44098:43-975(-)
MAPKETGSIEDDWSVVSGEWESTDDSDVPPLSEVLADGDPESQSQSTENSHIEEGSEANAAEVESKELVLEGDGRGEGPNSQEERGNTLDPHSYTEDKDSADQSAEEAKATVDSEENWSVNDVDANRTSPPSVDVVPSADLTDDGVGVDAISGTNISASNVNDVVGDETSPPAVDLADGGVDVDAISVNEHSVGKKRAKAVAETTEGDVARKGDGANEGKKAEPNNDTSSPPLWLWRTDNESWYPYDENDASMIESAFSSGGCFAVLDRGGATYIIDLSLMVQRNIDTGFLRELRRGWPDEHEFGTATTA